METTPDTTFTTSQLIQYAADRKGNPYLAAIAERLTTLTSALASATDTNRVLAQRLAGLPETPGKPAAGASGPALVPLAPSAGAAKSGKPESNSPLAPINNRLDRLEKLVGVPAQPATSAQKDEIRQLVRHSAVTGQLRTRTLLALDAYDEALANEKLAELRQLTGTPAPIIISHEAGGSGPSHEPVSYATAAQKEEIYRLLGHPLLSRPDKTKALLNINRYTEATATEKIAELRQTINQLENGERAAS